MLELRVYLEYWIFAIGLLAGLGVLHWVLWRGGKGDRISGPDWALIFAGLIIGWFSVNCAVKWQDTRIVGLIQHLVPLHAQLIEDGVRGKIILNRDVGTLPWGAEDRAASGDEAPREKSTAEAGDDSAGEPDATPLIATIMGVTDLMDRNGTWPIGYVPMFNRAGQLKAVLDVDIINETRNSAVDAMRKMATAVVASLFLAVLGVVVYFRVRTEYLRAELEIARALAESENRFRLLYDGSPDAIFVNDLNGFICDANPTACEMLQMESEELIGMHLADLVDPDQRAEAEQKFKKLAAGGTDRIDDTRFVAKDGRQIPVEVRARKILYPDSPAFLLHVHDLTTRITLENELRQAQKMEGIGQLAAGVAHDFNNLLTVIQGHTLMLLENNMGQEDVIDSLQEVASAAERAAELTADLLTFSRKRHMRLEILDVNAVLNNFVRLLGRVIPEHIDLQMKTVEKIPAVRADRGMLEQVITNLAVNARDAMPEGGTLTISTHVEKIDVETAFEQPDTKPGDYVVIKVSDTGTGIDAETRNNIFDPFFTTKDVGKGTGLGLASVYGIIAQHGGWIRVESAPGEGATFLVYLPVQKTSTAVVESPVLMEDEVHGGNETIFIVEDEPALRKLAALNLEKFGYNVIKAASGREALRLWKDIKDEVDLVLTDLVMPEGVSGRELGRRLNANNRGLPIVYMSGYRGSVTGTDDGEANDCPVLQKPFTPNVLARTIRATLDAS